MPSETIIAELKWQIARDRGILEALKSGSLHEANRDRTEGRIVSLERLIAENEKRLDSFGD